MKLVKLFTIAVLLLSATFLSAQKQLPDMELKTLDGATVNLADYAKNGKVTVISFWATWCKPCQAELDAIADLYPDWQEAYQMDMIAVTIDTRRQLAKVGPLVESKQWEYTILSDANNELRYALGFQSIPQTYVLDTEGNIVWEHSGYVPGNEYELEEVIAKYAGKAVKAHK